MSQLTKAVTAGREDAWLIRGLSWVAGYVVRLDDLTSPPTPESLFSELGLGFPSSPFAAGEAFCDVINLPPSPDLMLVSPAEGDGVAAMTDHAPFASGSGFVDSAAGFVPVWWAAPSRIPAGASVWRISADQEPRMIAGYASVAEGWVAGPGVTLPDTPVFNAHLLGMRAMWRGSEHLIDLLPDGRVIVCSAEEIEGGEKSARDVWWTQVSRDELTEVVVLRVLATWREVPVQVVALEETPDGVTAQIVYVGRDMLEAEAAGMTKTDAGVYESAVPADDLIDLREERRAVDLGAETSARRDAEPAAAEETPSGPVPLGDPTSAQQRLIAVGTELIHRLWPGIELNAFALPSDGAIVLVQPARGGVTLYVAADESVMFAASSLEPGAALELFRSGKRTDKAEFVPRAPDGSSR